MGIATWRRVDLHAHTPFDETRNWGKKARKARDRAPDVTEVTQAREWLERSREAGLHIVAVTDHNTVAGYDIVCQQLSAWREESGYDLVVLPGVELTLDGCHFLVITDPPSRDWLSRLVAGAFGDRDPVRSDGRPDVAEIGVRDLSRKVQQAAEGGRPTIALPAHIDKSKGLTRELSGLTGERAFAQRAWSGFQVRGSDFRQSRNLLRAWACAMLFSRDEDQLDESQRRILEDFVRREAWPLVEASDPEGLADLGSVFSWMKMEVAGVEGIRLSLLDPESRLRRHQAAPPAGASQWIESVSIEGVTADGATALQKPLHLEFSPALNTVIGGRGSGKSTIIELLRWGLDRDRPSDFPAPKSPIRHDVEQRLSADGDGILGDDTRVQLVLVIDDRRLEVVRTVDELTAGPVDGVGTLDVRTAFQPRILSQRQIAEIAREGAAIRREVDHAIRRRLADWQERRTTHLRTLETLQARRRELADRLATRNAVQTEIELLTHKIRRVDAAVSSDTIDDHKAIQRQDRWLARLMGDVEEASGAVATEPLLPATWPAVPPDGPAQEHLRDLRGVAQKHRQEVERARQTVHEQLNQLRDLLTRARDGEFATIRAPLVKGYETLIERLRSEGIELGQLDNLHARLAALRSELETLDQLPAQLDRTDAEIRTALQELDSLHRERRDLRIEVAKELADRDADIRLDVVAFGDDEELRAQRDRWWAGTGMRSADWETLVSEVHEHEDVPARWRELVDCLRRDHVELVDQSQSRASNVRGFVAVPEVLSGYLEGAIASLENDQLDAMQRFVPEDAVVAEFRATDGSFRPIRRASLGQRNTAILSLLLTVGDGPLLLDQPEDDLDNRYIYDVVVELLRSTKTRRQIITATHSANIPVNGDAEAIITLVANPETGGDPVLIGTLDRTEIKDAVSDIMEGSQAAFRLRRQRYGY